MYNARLGLQADIICGDGSQAWDLRSKTHNQHRTDSKGEAHPEPLNGLLNTVARFEVSRLNQGQPVHGRVAMDQVDNNAYAIAANPEAVDYDLWVCCFIHMVPMGNPISSALTGCLNAPS